MYYVYYPKGKFHIQWRIYIVKFWTRPLPPCRSDFIIFIFIQFSAKFGQKLGWWPPSLGLPLPRLRNHVSTAVYSFFQAN